MDWFLYENSLRHERVKALILKSVHQRKVQENKHCSMQSSNNASSKGNLRLCVHK